MRTCWKLEVNDEQNARLTSHETQITMCKRVDSIMLCCTSPTHTRTQTLPHSIDTLSRRTQFIRFLVTTGRKQTAFTIANETNATFSFFIVLFLILFVVGFHYYFFAIFRGEIRSQRFHSNFLLFSALFLPLSMSVCRSLFLVLSQRRKHYSAKALRTRNVFFCRLCEFVFGLFIQLLSFICVRRRDWMRFRFVSAMIQQIFFYLNIEST